MSGPKTFEAQMDAAIARVFNLQTEVQMRFAELVKMRINDKKRNIELDCREEIQSMQERVTEAVQAFSISSRLGKSEQDIRKPVQSKQEELESLLSLIRSTENSFSNKQKDYDAYVNYEQSLTTVKKALEDRKTAANQVIEKYISASSPEESKKAQEAISQITIDEQLPEFTLNFRKQKKQQLLQKKVEQSENEISKIRERVSSKTTRDDDKKDKSLKTKISGSKPALSAVLEKRISQINDLIASAENLHQSSQYKQRLDKLIHSDTFREEYFYIELLEEIKQTEQTLYWKNEVKKILSRLNVVTIHPSLSEQQKAKISQGLFLIDLTHVRENEFLDFEAHATELLTRNDEVLRHELTQVRERRYLKSQIIESLRIHRYEVIEESEVIDFEKENDFLMKIPGQANYLNLRFNKDGTFLYNYLIPENKNELGIAQKQQKLSEMTTTCTEFKALLAELAASGMNVGLAKDTEVSESALIQIPDKLKSRLESMEQRKTKKSTTQQKYMKP